MYLEDIEHRVDVSLELLRKGVLEGAVQWLLGTLELVELSAQELLPVPDRPGGGDVLAVAG